MLYTKGVQGNTPFGSTTNTEFVLLGKTVMLTTSKSLITTMTEGEFRKMAFERRTAAAWAIHPGEILKLEFLRPMGVTGYRLAQALDVKPQTVNDILLKKRGISAEMAVRLGAVFGMSAEFWMNLQAAYELANAKKTLRNKIKRVTPVAKVA
jgi:addiction module HigA family antidote